MTHQADSLPLLKSSFKRIFQSQLWLMCQLCVSHITHTLINMSALLSLYISFTSATIGGCYHTLGRASSFRSTSEKVCCYHGNHRLITLT